MQRKLLDPGSALRSLAQPFQDRGTAISNRKTRSLLENSDPDPGSGLCLLGGSFRPVRLHLFDGILSRRRCRRPVRHGGPGLCVMVVQACTAWWSRPLCHGGPGMYGMVVQASMSRWYRHVRHGGSDLYVMVVQTCTSWWFRPVCHGGPGMYVMVSRPLCHGGPGLYVMVVQACTS